MRKKELDGVQEGQLQISKREVSGMGVATNFGAHMYWGKKGTKGIKKDVVIDRGLEGSDIGGGIVDDVTVERDEAEKVLIYEFLLGVPKLLVILVDDCVLVWVVIGGGGTSRGGEELGKEISCNRAGWVFDGKRWERSGWLWSGGTRRRLTMNGGEDDGLR